jgi:hypothetical protein
MNTNNYSNIEFINIDSFEHQWDQECIKNDPIFEIDCLDKYLLEKYESEANSFQSDHFFSLENQTQLSFFSEPACKLTEIRPESPSPASSRSTCLSPSEVTSEIPEKNFICDFENCKKSFRFKWILDRHYLSHKSAKLFKCSFRGCTKSYKSKENLTLHFKNIHLKEKPYNCRYCPSVFSHRNGRFLNLILGKTYHERKFHTNYLPHHCTLEGKR